MQGLLTATQVLSFVESLVTGPRRHNRRGLRLLYSLLNHLVVKVMQISRGVVEIPQQFRFFYVAYEF